MKLASPAGKAPGAVRIQQRTTAARHCRTLAGMAAAAAILLGALAVPANAVPAPTARPATVQLPTVQPATPQVPFAPQYPSADDIEQAKLSEAATARQVETIEGILADAQVTLAEAQVEALKAQAGYNEALITLEERRGAAAAAQAEADAAAEQYTATKTEVGQLAGDLYRNGGVTAGVTALLTGGVSSDELLYRASTMQALTANRTQTLTEAESAAKVWAAQQISASAAQTAADEAADTADAAKTEALAAADAQSSLVAESAAKRDMLIEQLADLEGTTVALQEERIAGVEREQAQEALAAAIAASEARAAREQSENEDRGTPADSGTGLQSEQVQQVPARPSVTPPPPPAPAPAPAQQDEDATTGTRPERPPASPPARPADPPAAPAPIRPAPPKPAPPKPTPSKPAPTKPAPPPSGFSTSVMVDYAMSKVGVGHYAWGGNGPMGFDCSGLIRQAFSAAGKNIARGGTDQFWGAPVHVPLSQARYGDIIAFGSGPFYHVAIYLGNNKVVHALNPSQGIMVNDLSELVGMQPYYQAARY